jgi:hypothetical protein
MTQSAKNDPFVQPVLFPGLFDKPIVMEFTETLQTNDGGLTLFGALDRSIGLTATLASALADPRCPGKTRHTHLDILRQRVYGILGGHADGNDAGRLRNDPTFRVLLDKSCHEDDSLATQSTISRFENSLSASSLMRASHALCDFVIARQRRRHKHAPRITIDLDPTDDPTHGQQHFAFFNSYYDCWCYLPMLATITFHDRHGRECPEQHLVAAMLRPGKAKASLGAAFLIRRLVKKLRDTFPNAVLRIRLDGGFAAPEVLDLLESLDLEYVINMAKNNVLKEFAEPLMKQARLIAQRTKQSAQVFGECRYAAKTWKDKNGKPKKRRMIIKAEVTISPNEPDKEPRDNPRFVITNLKITPKHGYKVTYCRRGDVENRIKELHDGVSLGRTSCTDFLANQFRVLLSVAAYILAQEFRSICADTRAARWQVSTLRERLIKFGAVVVASSRRLLFRFARFAPDAELLSILGGRIAALAPT